MKAMTDTPRRQGRRFNPEKLLELRSLMGLTQREFGARVGYTGGMIGMVEGGQVRPSVKFLEKIAEVFDVDIRSFFD